MITSQFGDNIYASRITFRGTYPLFLLAPLAPSNRHKSPIPNQYYSSRYNLVQFSTFTKRPSNSFPSVSNPNTPSTSPFFHFFATPTYASNIGSDLVIIDITHPSLKLQLHPSSFMFDGWFGIPFLDGDNITHVRSPHSSEILQLYSFPPSMVHSLSLLPVSFQCSICLHVFPSHASAALANSIICDIVSPLCRLPNTSLLPISHCFTIRPAPTKPTWKTIYAADNDTSQIVSSILNSEQLSDIALQKLNVTYKHGIVNKLFQILEDKLVYYERTLTSSSCILRIVVPSFLRRDLFSAYHASSTGGHMGEYKTLYRLKFRFFWPRMRKDIKAWIKVCAHCNLTC